ncbi:hypothetical protein ACA910_019218 [Epithemia clementina (nom. ined.)]
MTLSSSHTTTTTTTSTILEDVDICVTCISDHPPQLPLRQELPSLGVEVVYRAKGRGLQTSRHEAREKVQQYRVQQATQDMTQRNILGIRPSSSSKRLGDNGTSETTSTSLSLFGPNLKHIRAKLAERKRIERLLKTPHALSYESYSSAATQHSSHSRPYHNMNHEDEDAEGEEDGGHADDEEYEYEYHDQEETEQATTNVLMSPKQHQHQQYSEYHHAYAESSAASVADEEAKQEKDEARSVDLEEVEKRESPPTPELFKALAAPPRPQPPSQHPSDEFTFTEHKNNDDDDNQDEEEAEKELQRINDWNANAHFPPRTSSYQSYNPVAQYSTKTNNYGAASLSTPVPTPPPISATPPPPVSLGELLARDRSNQSQTQQPPQPSPQTPQHQCQNGGGGATGPTANSNSNNNNDDDDKSRSKSNSTFGRFHPMAGDFFCPSINTERSDLRPETGNDLQTPMNTKNGLGNQNQDDKNKPDGGEDDMMDLLHAAASTLTSFDTWCQPMPNQSAHIDSPITTNTESPVVYQDHYDPYTTTTTAPKELFHTHVDLMPPAAPFWSDAAALAAARASYNRMSSHSFPYDEQITATTTSNRAPTLTTQLPPPPPPPNPPPTKQQRTPKLQQQPLAQTPSSRSSTPNSILAKQPAAAPASSPARSSPLYHLASQKKKRNQQQDSQEPHVVRLHRQPQPHHDEEGLPPWLSAMGSSPLFKAAKQRHKEQQRREREMKQHQLEREQMEQEQLKQEQLEQEQMVREEEQQRQEQVEQEQEQMKLVQEQEQIKQHTGDKAIMDEGRVEQVISAEFWCDDPPVWPETLPTTTTITLPIPRQNSLCHTPSQDKDNSTNPRLSYIKAIEKKPVVEETEGTRSWSSNYRRRSPTFHPSPLPSKMDKDSASRNSKALEQQVAATNSENETTPPRATKESPDVPARVLEDVNRNRDDMPHQDQTSATENATESITPPPVFSSSSPWMAPRIESQPQRNPFTNKSAEEAQEKRNGSEEGLGPRQEGHSEEAEMKTPDRQPQDQTPQSSAKTPFTGSSRFSPDLAIAPTTPTPAVGDVKNNNIRARQKLSLRELLARDRSVRDSAPTPTPLPSPPPASFLWQHQQVQLRPKQSPLSISDHSFSSSSPSPRIVSPPSMTMTQSTPLSAAALSTVSNESWVSQGHEGQASATTYNEKEKVTPPHPAVSAQEKNDFQEIREQRQPRPSPRTMRLSIPTLLPDEGPQQQIKQRRPTGHVAATSRAFSSQAALQNHGSGKFDFFPTKPFHPKSYTEAKKMSASLFQPSSELSFSSQNSKYRARASIVDDSVSQGGREKTWTPTPSLTPSTTTTPDRDSVCASSVNSKKQTDDKGRPTVGEPTMTESSSVPITKSATTPNLAPRGSPGRVAQMVKLYSKG